MDQVEHGRFVCDATVARSAAILRLDQMESVVGANMKAVTANRLNIGSRKRKALRTSLAAPSTHTSLIQADISSQELTPSSLNVLGNRVHPCPATNYETPQNHLLLSNGTNETDLIVQITQANVLPPPVISQALSDFYFSELYHLVPVLDRGQDELERSLLLRQALYFAGSGMRRSTEGPSEWSTPAIYKRIKTLISLDYEPEPLNVLGSLCILACYPMHPTHEVALDNPWQWAGMAIRLALQLQLHDENTYVPFKNPGIVRRIWWYLFMNDTMQMGCSGRPGMFPLSDCNVRLPTVADFKMPTAEAHVFCAMATLCRELREVLQMGKFDNVSQVQVFTKLTMLRVWRENLPHDLNLFDETKEIRQRYNRAVAELHIFYLTTIILTCFLGRRENCPLLKCASIVASSCISRLYEEILYHEGTPFLLPIHAWANLVASIPRTFSKDEQIPNQANEKRIGRMVLEKMSEKHPGVKLVQQRIDEIGRLGASVFSTPDNPADVQNTASLPSTEITGQILALFPFPLSFCSTLELFVPDPGETEQPDLLSDLLIDINNWDWPVDWSSFLF
ncbi:hypothetical protein N7490_011090 [Penicillium lividum]|nr:hypothetical protein N7490_011090 [Penicillium lividum]